MNSKNIILLEIMHASLVDFWHQRTNYSVAYINSFGNDDHEEKNE